MEKVYKPEHFNSTSNIDIGEYFTKYKDALFEQQKTVNKNITEEIARFTNLSNSELLELEDNCSVDKLKVPGESDKILVDNITGNNALATLYRANPINDDSLTLESVKAYKKRSDNIHESLIMTKYLQGKSFSVKAIKPKGTGPTDLTPGEEFIIFVRLFQPFTFMYSEPSYNSLRFDHEIVLLGSNTLSELRDKICCAEDIIVMTDVSESLQTDNLTSAQGMYPSGFLFIDGTFYNDFRNENAIDYSKILIKWAQDKKIGSFKTAEMSTTKLSELKPRFGYPYVYQHQGHCEHVFIFSYARLLNSNDLLYRSLYPYHNNVSRNRQQMCLICGKSTPFWLLMYCDRIPQDKTLACNECLLSYCYVDGKKIGSFQLYPYTDRVELF